ncbi:MAG: hypothetical protein JO102_04645 [Elusimicrobia bacterium]|nr:hypothetical protein [Elusimicrobiota bacterium]
MKPRFLSLAGIVFAAALWRLVPHPWNVTPVAAMALFAGAHFSSRRAAYAVPLAAIFLSDLVLGFYPTMPWVYAAFALIVFIGTFLRSRRDTGSVALGAISGSVLFFLVTNFGHWVSTSMYPKSPAGLAACFTAAIPFFRNTLLGDVAFTAAFFGGFAVLERRFPALRESPAVERQPGYR